MVVNPLEIQTNGSLLALVVRRVGCALRHDLPVALAGPAGLDDATVASALVFLGWLSGTGCESLEAVRRLMNTF